MMEDLRITGYNALLTPAFLQEEFPTVSLCVLPRHGILSNLTFDSLRNLNRHPLLLVMNVLKYFKVKTIVLLSSLVLVLSTTRKLPKYIVSIWLEDLRYRFLSIHIRSKVIKGQGETSR
jgi:hypothetical protein